MSPARILLRTSSQKSHNSNSVNFTNRYHWQEWLQLGMMSMGFTLKVLQGGKIDLYIYGPTQYKKYARDEEAYAVYGKQSILEVNDTISAQLVYDDGVAAHIVVERANASPQEIQVKFECEKYY